MEASEIAISVLGARDVGKLWPVYSAAMPDPWSRAGLLAALEADEGRAWGSSGPEGRLLAFALARHVVDEMHLDAIATEPTARRRGLGRALIEHVCASARADGCGRILLEVRASNRAALGLYEGVGFVVDGRRPRYYPDGEAAVLMSLRL